MISIHGEIDFKEYLKADYTQRKNRNRRYVTGVVHSWLYFLIPDL